MFGINVLDLAQPYGDGRHQQNGGDIVQEGGQEPGEEAECIDQWPRLALGQFEGDHGEVVEKTRFTEDGHQNHHAEQKAKCFHVQPRNNFFKRWSL